MGLGLGHFLCPVESDIPSLSLTGCQQPQDESQVSLSFQAWLASVTERIHQTMHYQFEGKVPLQTPSPLFHFVILSFWQH